MSQKRKIPRQNIKDEFFQSVGVEQFRLGVCLEDGPCFQTTRQSLAWQKGWMITHVFNEGFAAGLDGKTLSDNPYARSTTTAPTCMGLAESWRNGFCSSYTALNTGD